MEKRIFIAVIVSLGLLWAWAAVAPKLFPDLVKKPPVQTQTTSTTSTAAPTPAPATATTNVPAPAHATNVAPAPVLPPISATEVKNTTIENDDYIAVFSNRGAQLVSFKLRKYLANPTKKSDSTLVELVKERDPQRTDFPFALESADKRVNASNAALFAVDEATSNGSRVVTFKYSAGGLSIVKTFTFTGEYPFTFTVSVSPAVPYRVAIGPGIRTLGPEERDNQFTVTGNGAVQRDDSLKVINREKSDALSIYPGVQYIGVEDNYFLTALKPAKGGDGVFRRIEQGADKNKRRELYAAVNSANDGTVTGSAFFGPKETGLLDRYGYEKTLQFGMS